MIGIPYATADSDADGTMVRICPECGERIREATDKVGEQKTNGYAAHYAAEHTGAAA
jgi:hypothetical protein